MDEQINYNLTLISTWKRIFFMLIFAAIGSLVRVLIWGVILLQVGSTLLTGKANTNILSFGENLSSYTSLIDSSAIVTIIKNTMYIACCVFTLSRITLYL